MDPDLVSAWILVLILAAVLGVMPFVPALLPAVGYDVEGSFGASLLVLTPFVLLVVLVTTGAVRFGMRAYRRGGSAGLFPATIAAVIGGSFLLLQLVAILGHLLSLE